MKNQHLLILSMILILSCNPSEEKVKASKQLPFQYELPFQPNILWLVAEDLSPVIPSFGDSTIQTPNLSRLAAEGICYDNRSDRPTTGLRSKRGTPRGIVPGAV